MQTWVLVFSDSERPFRPPALSEKPWNESMGALARDISQSPYRIRYSKFANGLHVAGTQKPDQVVMLDVQPRRLQLGLESMLIQGFPVYKFPETVASVSDHTLMNLAGNSFAASVPLAILLCLFESAGWHDQGLACCENADAEMALSWFHMSVSGPGSEPGGSDSDDIDEEEGFPIKRRCLEAERAIADNEWP